MSELEFSLPLTARSSESLQVFLLGAVDFDSALRLQEQFRDEVIQRHDRFGGLFEGHLVGNSQLLGCRGYGPLFRHMLILFGQAMGRRHTSQRLGPRFRPVRVRVG